MIECRMLGPVALTVNGSAPPAELLWRKNLALFVYLACSPRRARTREHLTALLWGEKPEAAARHSLRESLRILRHALGEGILRTDGEVVALAEGSVRLDVERFAEREAAGDWRGAAALVHGEFLEGIGVADASAFEDWLAAERAAWRARGVAALVRHGEALLASGDAVSAVDAALRARRLDPQSADAVRAAMRALALVGDRAGALAQHEDYARRLDALGVPADGEMADLAARVRTERTGPGRPAHRPAAGGERARRTPLVGRATELQRLLGAWERCAGERRAAAAVIEAEPGLGKTRLIEELLARARLEGAAVTLLRAVQADRGAPASGLVALARAGLLDVPGVPAAPPGALAAFAAAIPEWADRFPGRAAIATGLGVALGEVLRVAAEEQPVIVAVDDAHWMDRDSLLALGGALRTAATLPLFLCFGVVPHHEAPELDELRSHLGRDFPGTTSTLAPLDQGAVLQLTRWALPQLGEEGRLRLTRRLLADSAGIPLLVVELLHAVAHGLDLGRLGGAWPTPARTLDDTLPGDLPDAVVAAIRVGFRRLSPDAQRVLATASALEERVSTERLGHASGVVGRALNDVLDELEWQRWLTGEPRGYTFLARIVREVIARDMLTPGQRQRLQTFTGEL